MDSITNTRQLQALIKLSVDSAREEIDKINFRKIESSLSEDSFNEFFRHITVLDEALKTIQFSINGIMNLNPETRPNIDIDPIFEKEDTMFRLFYMINDYLNKWQFLYKENSKK